jgi:AcrR family transcriptional regulator
MPARASTPSPSTSPRERILNVADQLFYAHGINAVGVDTIVAQSGAAKTTLYANFGSKDELVAAYLRKRSERWRTYLVDELQSRAQTPRQRLLAVFDILAGAVVDPSFRGCPFINATAELADPSRLGREVVAEHRAWVRELLRGLAAEVGARHPAEVAAELQMLYDAVLVSAQVEGGSTSARRARKLAQLVLSRHRAPAPR